MTPKEIQRTIEGMLEMQQELQNSQLQLKERQDSVPERAKSAQIGFPI